MVIKDPAFRFVRFRAGRTLAFLISRALGGLRSFRVLRRSEIKSQDFIALSDLAFARFKRLAAA